MPHDTTNEDLHHITRIDIEPDDEHPDRSSTHGWLVRARRQGNRISKFFSDKKHGGREEALYEHAIPYRDELLEELPEPEDAAKKSAEARSRSGVVGLNLTFKDIGNGTKKPYVQVSWMDDDGKRRAASYSPSGTRACASTRNWIRKARPRTSRSRCFARPTRTSASSSWRSWTRWRKRRRKPALPSSGRDDRPGRLYGPPI
ncbi:MAG: hypothetical protein GVY18_03000 [Bacteroidetes bacterium]|jgi:hypothetical protein|nr:hypothetical protein [Bacteroidota bacterium]